MSRTIFGLHFNRIPLLPAIGIVRPARTILQLYHRRFRQKTAPPPTARNIDRTTSGVALSPPRKANITLVVVSSASFFWFLSATLFVAAGGYVANHEACLREAHQLIERHGLIGVELLGRQRSFSSVPGFSKITYGDVQQEWLKVLRRVKYEDLPDGSIEKLQREWLEFNPQGVDDPVGGVTTPTQNDVVKANSVLESKVRKLRSPSSGGYDSFLRDLDTYAYFFQANCTPLRTLGVALGNEPQIVLASVSPLVENSSMRSLRGQAAGSTSSNPMRHP